MERGSAGLADRERSADREQPLRALQHANRIRSARARMKRAIARGELSVAEVLVECPEHVKTMAIADLLMCQRRWGETRCRRLLETVGISERRPVGSLTQRQRLVVAAMLEWRERLGQSEPSLAPVARQPFFRLPGEVPSAVGGHYGAIPC